jgi:hypothetical protein
LLTFGGLIKIIPPHFSKKLPGRAGPEQICRVGEKQPFYYETNDDGLKR